MRKNRFMCKAESTGPKHRAFTLLELLILIIVLAVATVILLSIRGGTQSPPHRTIKCYTQLKSMHQAWILWSQDYQNRFPVPTQISQSTADKCTQTGNSTANLHSLMIYNNAYSPELTVCPSEGSGFIQVHDDYDWGNRATSLDETDQWDWDFSCDISGNTTSARTGQYYSNVSYANNPLIGSRFNTEWADTLNSKFAMLSDRGPKDGLHEKESATYLQHGARNIWVGNVVYNDSHVETVKERVKSDNPFTFNKITWSPPAQSNQPKKKQKKFPDNFFAEDDPTNGSDIWLAVFGNTTETKATPIWDP